MSDKWYCQNCGIIEAIFLNDFNECMSCAKGEDAHKNIPTFVLAMQERISALENLVRQLEQSLDAEIKKVDLLEKEKAELQLFIDQLRDRFFVIYRPKKTD